MLTIEHICVIIITKSEGFNEDDVQICPILLNSFNYGFIDRCCNLYFFREHTYINSFFGLQKISSRDSLLLDAISFYLPDFLWAYSLTFMLALFCEHRLSGVISSLFGVVWEIMQRIGAVSGTFDMIDILMYITASMFAVLILLFNRRKRI